MPRRDGEVFLFGTAMDGNSSNSEISVDCGGL
jgi:hypothetical protein